MKGHQGRVGGMLAQYVGALANAALFFLRHKNKGSGNPHFAEAPCARVQGGPKAAARACRGDLGFCRFRTVPELKP